MNSSKLVEILILHYDAFFDSPSTPIITTAPDNASAVAGTSSSRGAAIHPLDRNSFVSVSASNVHSRKEKPLQVGATDWN